MKTTKSNVKFKDKYLIKLCMISLLLVAPFSVFHDIFTIPKLIGVSLVIAISFAAHFQIRERHTIQRNTFLGLLILPPLSFLITSFFNEYSFFNNFIGDYLRYNGIYFAFVTSIIIWLISTIENLNINDFFKLCLRINLVIILFQFTQEISLNFLGIVDSNRSSLMGNTNFTSAVISTLALALLAQKEIFNENNIVYTCIFSLITILSLYLLNSFQSILILCVGIYTFLTFKITKKLHVKFQKLMISLYLILWFLGMSFLYNFVHLDPISRILELSGNYGRRLEYWGYAIKMFQDSPLVGIGINGFLDKAQTLKSIDVIRADGPLVWIDSAHSAPLHLLATGGLTLFLPYCLLLFSTFFAALKISLSLSKDRLSDSIIASMWFAFTAQSLLSVSNAATLLFNAILTGIVWQRYFTLKLNEEKNQRKLMKIVLSTKIWQRLLSFHKLFVIIICIGFSGYLMATQIALSQNVLGNKVKIMNVFQVSKIFPSDRAIEYLADASLQRGEYQDAIKLLEKARVINRNGNRATYSLGVAYFYAGDQSAGIKHVSNALALDPYNTFYLEQLIRFQFRANQADDAAASLDALEKLNPDYPGLSSLRGLLSP